MEADRWTRLKHLLPDALEHEPVARGAFLDAACVDADGLPDVALRAEVEALLSAHEAAERTDAFASPFMHREAAVAALGGARAGAWRLVEPVGSGGMGEVWRAERADGVYRQTAALKLLRPGLGPDFHARFLRERQLLAGLRHSGIARLLDGGEAGHGAAARPFLAVEFVEGEPITAYAYRRALDVEARIGLFLQVCDPVAYAHRHLVVHRDLKPSNVLVTEEGGQPVVKLLDFGIAKLLGDGGADAAPLTRTGLRVMTPEYAAPEQVTGGGVTTATDVYALGVLLFELLTGRRPYDLTGRTAAEVERLVCEATPARPSTVVVREPEGGRAAPYRRLRGDLDTVVMKALEKEPERRYASADALADDLRRFLDGLPVRARAATLGYRAGRFVRRNRLAVAAALAVALALVAGAGVVLRQARVARAEADKATAMSTFLQSTLLSASPGIGAAVRPSDLRVVDVLRPAAEEAQAAFPGRPDVQAAVLYTVGRTYLDLGLWDEAREATLTALTIRDSLYGNAPHEERIQSYDVAARVAQMRNDTAAIGWAQRALALRTARYGPDSPEVVEGLGAYGDLLVWFSHYDEALSMLHQALALAQRTRGDRSPEADRARYALVQLFLQTDRAAEADTLLGTLIAHAREDGPADDPNLALYIHSRGVAALMQHHVDRAERFNTEALRRMEARFDGDHPILNQARGVHAALLIERGQYQEAEAIMRAAVEAFEASLEGTDRFELHLARAELGAALAGLGRTDEAERLLREGTDRLRAKLGDTYGWTRHVAGHLADLYEAVGRPLEARRYRAIADAPPAGP